MAIRYLSQFPTTGLIGGFIYKDANYTAISNDKILVNSLGGAVTITLPAIPNNGAFVGVYDQGMDAATNFITIDRNGIDIDTIPDDVIIDVNGGRWEFVYDGNNTTWRGSYETVNGRTGLSQAEVDARVASHPGKHTEWLRPGRDLIYTSAAVGHRAPATYWATDVFTQGAASDNSAFSWVTVLPKRYDGLGLRFRFIWESSDADTGNCYFIGLSTGAAAHGTAFSIVPSSSFVVLSAGSGVSGAVHISNWGSCPSPAGWTSETLSNFWFRRSGTNVEDTYTGTSYVMGLQVEYGVTGPTDD